MSSKFYCGDKEEVPGEYHRRGSRRECLRKGVGVGLHLQHRDNERLSNRTTNEEKELKMLQEERLNERRPESDARYNLSMYRDFLDKNFERAKETTIRLDNGDIFRRLAQLWILDKQLENEILKEAAESAVQNDDEKYEQKEDEEDVFGTPKSF